MQKPRSAPGGLTEPPSPAESKAPDDDCIIRARNIGRAALRLVMAVNRHGFST